MTRKVSVAEAKNNLPSIIHEVESGTYVEITRHGKSVVIVIATGDFQRLSEKGRGLWKDLRRVRNIMASEGIAITEDDYRPLRDTSNGRPFEWTL